MALALQVSQVLCRRCERSPIRIKKHRLCGSCASLWYQTRARIPGNMRESFSIEKFLADHPNKRDKTAEIEAQPQQPREEGPVPVTLPRAIAKALFRTENEVKAMRASIEQLLDAALAILSILKESKSDLLHEARMRIAPNGDLPSESSQAGAVDQVVTVSDGEGAVQVVIQPQTSDSQNSLEAPERVSIDREEPVSEIDKLLKNVDPYQARGILINLLYDSVISKTDGSKKLEPHIRLSMNRLKKYLGPTYSEEESLNEVTRAFLLVHRFWKGGRPNSEPEREFRRFVDKLRRDIAPQMDPRFYSFLRNMLEHDRVPDKIDLSKFFELVGFDSNR